MHCALSGAKQISQPEMTHCKLDPWEQSTGKFESKYNIFLLRIYIWINVGRFVQTLSYWTQSQYYGWYCLRWSVLSEHHTLHQADLSLCNTRIRALFFNPISYSSQTDCVMRYSFLRWIQIVELRNCILELDSILENLMTKREYRPPWNSPRQEYIKSHTCNFELFDLLIIRRFDSNTLANCILSHSPRQSWHNSAQIIITQRMQIK